MTVPDAPVSQLTIEQRRRPRVSPRASAQLINLGFSAPAVAYVGIFALFPIGWFLLRSVQAPGGNWTLDHFRAIWSQTSYLTVLWRTILLSCVATAIAVTLAYPVALSIRRTRGVLRVLLLTGVVLPYLTSVLVRTFAWSEMLALRGPVNDAFVAVGIFGHPKLLGHSQVGTVVGLVHILTPTAVLAIWAVMTGVDDGLERVAMGLGASRLRAFWTVFFPLSLPGVGAGAALVFVLSLGAFVIPAALGGLGGVMFGQVVVVQATLLLNWSFAAALAVTFLAVLAIPLLATLVIRRSGASRPHHISLHRAVARPSWTLTQFVGRGLDAVPPLASRCAAGAATTLVVAFLVLPEVVVIILSFGPTSYLNWPPESLGFGGYRQFVASPEWTGALGRSIEFALPAASIAGALGALAAYASARMSPAAARVLLAVLLVPLALPEIIPAISYYIFAVRTGMDGTVRAVVLGQAVTGVGLVVVVVRARLLSLDPNLELAARVCGASRLRAVRDVVVPIAAPAIAVGWLYAFLNAFDNLLITLFVGGNHQTLPVRIWLQLTEVTSPLTAVAASIMIGALLVLVSLSLLLGSRRGAEGLFRRMVP